MTDSMLCPFCGSENKMEPVNLAQKTEIEGRTVTFESPAHRCSACGHEIFTPEQMDASLRAGREAFERQYCAPSPVSLVALRERYGASQKAFGLLLGFGELTMNTYEQGATPDSTNRLLLKLADKPACFLEMYKINKETIGLIQRRRIESSEGFLSGAAWNSMAGLSGELTDVEKNKVEACAKATGVPVAKKVAEYIRAASFKDYSDLLVGATWSGKGIRFSFREDAHEPLEHAS